MTRFSGRVALPGTRETALDVAVACLGILLLVGTALWHLPSLVAGPRPAKTLPAVPAWDRADLKSRAGQAAPMRARAVRDDTSRETERSGVLDINRADTLDLERLPGIGSTLAGRIVAYRAKYGPFRAPEELLQVSGIGLKRYARLQGAIRVGEAP